MAGKQATFVAETKYGRLTLKERAGADEHRHPLVRCLCDCGKETIALLSKVRSADPKQWTHSCGCLKTENYLAYWAGLASHLSPDKRTAIFAERCSRIDAQAIAAKYGITKDLVDAAVRHRQSELRNYPDLEVVKGAVLANMPYERIASLCDLQVHEVAWLAKSIRAEHKLELKSLSESKDLKERFASDAYFDVGAMQFDMEEQKRRHFWASEWTEAKHWKRPKDRTRSHVMFAYDMIDLMEIHATTPERKDRLRWFRTTIAETIVHRRQLKRKHAIKASLSGYTSEQENSEVDLSTAA
jgi:hypothetical protein